MKTHVNCGGRLVCYAYINTWALRDASPESWVSLAAWWICETCHETGLLRELVSAHDLKLIVGDCTG